MDARRFETRPESIERELRVSINRPGLLHIDTKLIVCDAEPESGKIDFTVAGQPVGVFCMICADGSFVLVEDKHGKRVTRNWTSDEATPEEIKPAVVAALWARVIALTGTA